MGGGGTSGGRLSVTLRDFLLSDRINTFLPLSAVKDSLILPLSVHTNVPPSVCFTSA